MKIRSGFVSNSSSSSFVLLYIPPDFDYDSHVEYMLDKYKNKEHEDFGNYHDIKNFLGALKKEDIDLFVQKGRRGRMDFYDISFFFEDYVVYETTLDYEGYDRIERVDKRLFDKFANMDSLSSDNTRKFKDLAGLKKKKREYLKNKMIKHDPYGEEDWDEDLDKVPDTLDELERGPIDESHKIKKFKEL
jgi:hypothetical protein